MYITTDRFLTDRTLKCSMLHCHWLTTVQHWSIFVSIFLFAIEHAFRVIFPKLYIIYQIIILFNGRTAALFKRIYWPWHGVGGILINMQKKATQKPVKLSFYLIFHFYLSVQKHKNHKPHLRFEYISNKRCSSTFYHHLFSTIQIGTFHSSYSQVTNTLFRQVWWEHFIPDKGDAALLWIEWCPGFAVTWFLAAKSMLNDRAA